MEIKVLASGSSGNAYIVDDGETPILLEAGLPISKLRKLSGFRLHTIKGCLISHCHLDHSQARADLAKLGIPCYAPKGMPVTTDQYWPKWANLRDAELMARFEVGTWGILPFDCVHDVPCLGFLMVSKLGPKVVYATDTAYIKHIFTGVTHFLLGTNYASDILADNIKSGRIPAALKKRLIHSHASLDTIKDFLKAQDLSKTEAVYLLHLSAGNSDAERFAKEIREVTGKPTYIGGD